MCTSHFICKGSKGLCGVLLWEGAGHRTELQHFDLHSDGRQRCVFLVLLMLNRRPRGLFCWVLAFFTASYQQLLWTLTQTSPQGPSGLMWLSLPHFVYNTVRSLWNSSGAPRPDVALPTTPRLSLSPTLLQLVWLLSWLSYIIVQRPLSRLLDFWNRMIDRHPAEITVMHFTGHSLPVHQSMSVPWESFYLVPLHQPISAHVISSHNCH